MQEEDWLEVASYFYANEMALAKCALEGAGIPVREMNENVNGLRPHYKDLMGGMRLSVPISYLEDARTVLEGGCGISDEELARQSAEYPVPEE